ncbi:hypothetical protein HGRIS_001351 [Hohenbuehelia grisea]|uniref:Uncharacterized protein n=1 Tax=Hohenbuehelia grisea TaxID=104357 RepID=A0ABR3JR87_9AGAR
MEGLAFADRQLVAREGHGRLFQCLGDRSGLRKRNAVSGRVLTRVSTQSSNCQTAGYPDDVIVLLVAVPGVQKAIRQADVQGVLDWQAMTHPRARIPEPESTVKRDAHAHRQPSGGAGIKAVPRSRYRPAHHRIYTTRQSAQYIPSR